ncbi:MAG: nucleotidyltransferase domain-containing protein [Oscillospiraceae bacterium]|jgi:predicted nucleotidyltransferase|nr:nucleotidyltransferase domain-containing protein [Oscillospiraceae bacterium]
MLFRRCSGAKKQKVLIFPLQFAIIIAEESEAIPVIYTIEQLKERIAPVANKYGLPAVYLFGSYARGEATDDSDIDLLVDKTGANLHGLFAMGGLYNDLSEVVEKPIDMLTTSALEQECTKERTPWMVENLQRERVKIYG